MRCVGPDQTGATVTLHYLMDGTVRARLTVQKAEYFIPVMLLLKALQPTSAEPSSPPLARTRRTAGTAVPPTGSHVALGSWGPFP